MHDDRGAMIARIDDPMTFQRKLRAHKNILLAEKPDADPDERYESTLDVNLGRILMDTSHSMIDLMPEWVSASAKGVQINAHELLKLMKDFEWDEVRLYSNGIVELHEDDGMIARYRYDD